MTNNPFSLDGKTILVTGASSGIGRQIAITCSQMGANIIATGRNEERLNNTLVNLSNNENQDHKYVVADVCTDDGISMLVNNIAKLDGVVFCAGRNDKFLLKYIKRKNIEEMFNTNVFSEILICKELQKQKKLNNAASIVFISSISSTYATISNALYASTKGAINSLIRVLALELASKKIRVNGIMPGMVKTNMLDAYQLSEEEMQSVINEYPLKRLGETEDIAKAAVYLLSDASSWTTGLNMTVDGGITLR